MCLAQGPQRSDAGEARTRGPSVSSQALYHWATALPTWTLSEPCLDYLLKIIIQDEITTHFFHYQFFFWGLLCHIRMICPLSNKFSHTFVNYPYRYILDNEEGHLIPLLPLDPHSELHGWKFKISQILNYWSQILKLVCLQMSRDMWIPTMWHFDTCRLRRACVASF